LGQCRNITEIHRFWSYLAELAQAAVSLLGKAALFEYLSCGHAFNRDCCCGPAR
jgi:hypothetical protein